MSDLQNYNQFSQNYDQFLQKYNKFIPNYRNNTLPKKCNDQCKRKYLPKGHPNSCIAKIADTWGRYK